MPSHSVISACRLRRVGQNTEQAEFRRIHLAVGPVLIDHPPAHSAGPDLMTVRVGPGDCRLEEQVQPAEPDSKRHLDPASRGGFDIIKGNF